MVRLVNLASEIRLRTRSATSLQVEIGPRQDSDQFLAAIPCGQIAFADTILQNLGDEAQHLITDKMTVGVIEFL